MSLPFLKRKRERKYGEVKPQPPVRRGLEWLSPRTREAQRFMRTPELKPVGNRWGQRSLGTVAQVPVVPVVSGQAVSRAAPVGGAPFAGGGQPFAQPSTTTPTQQATIYGAGHAYTVPTKPHYPAPVPVSTPSAGAYASKPSPLGALSYPTGAYR